MKIRAVFLGGPLDGHVAEITPVPPFTHWPPRVFEHDGAVYRYHGTVNGEAVYALAPVSVPSDAA